MAALRREECVARSVVKLWVRCRWADWSSAGRVEVASSWSEAALLLRSGVEGWLSGSAILQRCLVIVLSWVERASAMMSALERKASMSLERISRSEAEIWPWIWAVAMSMRGCSSGGRSAAFESRSESELMRIWEERREVRAEKSACG